MFRCGKTLIAFALMMANPVDVSAQTTDNPPASSSTPQPATALLDHSLSRLFAQIAVHDRARAADSAMGA